MPRRSGTSGRPAFAAYGVKQMQRAIVVLAVVLVSAAAHAKTIQIVAFGDSATAGYLVARNDAYPAQLQRTLRAKGYDVEVRNEGISGDTAAGALSFIEKPERKGSHGHDASIPGLHATFVAWGAGIRPGAKVGEITNLDVAPTIAKLLGVPMPNVDGKPLDGVLAE